MHGDLDQALRSAQSRLDGPSGVAESEELIGRLLGLTRSELYLDRHRALTPEQWDRLDSWLRRRVRGEPIQHITGRAAFRSLDLTVCSDVLIPRPETEMLVQAVLDTLEVERDRWIEPRIVDLGTGSGAIALAIASEWPAASVTATDVSAAALRVARTNAAELGLSERVRFLEGDWFDALGDDRFDVVVSNPPYVAESERDELEVQVREYEPEAALFSGESGLDDLRTLIDTAPRHLVAGGLLALELSERRADEVAEWLDGARDWQGVRLIDDLTGRPRVLLARRQAGPAIAPAQWEEEEAR